MKQNLRLLLTLLLLLAFGSGEAFADYSTTTFKSDFTEGQYVVFADYIGENAVVPDWMKLPTGTKSINYGLDTSKGEIVKTSSKVTSPFVKTSDAATLKLNVKNVSKIKVFYRNNGGSARTLKAKVNDEAAMNIAEDIAAETNGVAEVALTYADENIVHISGTNDIVVFGIQVECNNSTVSIESPVFSPTPGYVDSGATITCSCETEGTTIRYTTDGSTPTNDSAVFPTTGISITANTTFNAIAFDNAGNKSSMVTASYLIRAAVTSLETMSNETWVFGEDLQALGLKTTFDESQVVANKLEISKGTIIYTTDTQYAEIDGNTFATRLDVPQNSWFHIKVAGNKRVTLYASTSGAVRVLNISPDMEGETQLGSITIEQGQNVYKAYTFDYTGESASDLIFTNTSNGKSYIVGLKVGPIPNEITPTLTATDVKVKVGKTASSTITAMNGEEEIEGLTYTYEVTSGSDYASVDENGVVTGLAIGKAVVKVTSTAVEEQYLSATTTFNVTVLSDATAGGVYKRVTSTDQLEAEKEYIFVAYDTNGSPLNYALGAQNGTYRNPVSAKVLTMGGEDYVTISESDPVTMVILKGETDKWSFLTYDEENYLCLPEAKNQLNVMEKTAFENADNNTKKKSQWTIVEDEEGKKDFTIWNNWNDAYTLQYNPTSGQQRFCCYKNTQDPVYLFVKMESIPVDITAVGYSTLYYGEKSLIVPSGVKAHTYKLTASEDDVRILDTYEEGAVIPKDCGVVLEAITKSEDTQTFYFAEGTTEAVAPESNLLLGFDEASTTVGPDGGSDYLFYMLSTDKNGENVGFYWGKPKGAAFTCGAHKAYLAISKSSGVNMSAFVFDDLNGISAITTDNAKGAEGVYTLSGVRMNSNQLPKGIYIVNGKKMVIK